jgi:aspartate-semialdehyde dehydrogenase
MKAGLGLLGIAGTGAIAEVGQRALSRFAGHPTLEIRGFIADDPADVGKRFGDLVAERWIIPDEEPAAEWLDSVLLPIEGKALRDAGIDLVQSALPKDPSIELEPKVAATGLPLVSGSQGLRLQPDVPLVVPEVNPDHLDLIKTQMAGRGWDTGYLVAAPLCTAVITALALKPIQDAVGISNVILTSMQAVSGMGQSGLPGMKIMDNILPHIRGEEEKMTRELGKIMGTIEGDSIQSFPAPITSTCTRVPVRQGHTISLTLGLESPAEPEAIAGLLADFVGPEVGGTLHLSPEHPIVVHDSEDRPQPLLDRDREGGRVISVGRIRKIDAFDNGIGMVLVGHNHERGTWGNTFMLCEHLVTRGLVG